MMGSEQQGPPNVPQGILRRWIEWLRAHGTKFSEGESWRRFEQEQVRHGLRAQQLSKRKAKNRKRSKMQRQSRRQNRT